MPIVKHKISIVCKYCGDTFKGYKGNEYCKPHCYAQDIGAHEYKPRREGWFYE